VTVVISDTSPINYLVLIGEIGLLPALYRRILIPDAVLAELGDAGSPPTVVAWASILPDWIEVVLTAVEPRDSSLDAGELAAITLAESLEGDIFADYG
jgi:predicted nucleic acid-binding protein